MYPIVVDDVAVVAVTDDDSVVVEVNSMVYALVYYLWMFAVVDVVLNDCPRCLKRVIYLNLQIRLLI